MHRRNLIVMAAAALATAVAAAPAFAMETYTKASFDRLMAAGQPVIVHVHATWCPVCKAQEPTLATLARDEATRGATQVRVDFDKDKEFLRANNVPSQSVILVFKGGKETGRIAGKSRMDEVKPVVVAAIR
jgi:thioredoxin 1